MPLLARVEKVERLQKALEVEYESLAGMLEESTPLKESLKPLLAPIRTCVEADSPSDGTEMRFGGPWEDLEVLRSFTPSPLKENLDPNPRPFGCSTLGDWPALKEASGQLLATQAKAGPSREQTAPSGNAQPAAHSF